MRAYMLRARTVAALARAGITTVAAAGAVGRSGLVAVTNVGVLGAADAMDAVYDPTLEPRLPPTRLVPPRPL